MQDQQLRRVTVDALLDEARATYQRITPVTAWEQVRDGLAVLVDIRPAPQRLKHGEVNPALHPVVIERTVLEWRLDPANQARLPWVNAQTRIIVLCQQGYSSSLAAATLNRMGLAGATDVIGGFDAWRHHDCPVV